MLPIYQNVKKNGHKLKPEEYLPESMQHNRPTYMMYWLTQKDCCQGHSANGDPFKLINE